jgi:thiosulfate dehydrogenase
MNNLIRTSHRPLWLIKGVLICMIALMLVAFQEQWFDSSKLTQVMGSKRESDSARWFPPAMESIPSGATRELIRFGRELIQHTARYLGPKGSVRAVTNGLNCQNCHLDAGTRPFAANFSAVASSYPKFRARSGSIEDFEKRVNDCIERSLNGTALSVDGREMAAIVAYLKWIGNEVPKGITPFGAGLVKLRPLDRAADPAKGSVVYSIMCARCHGYSGQGTRTKDGVEWIYPPLWGAHSYNTGAGLFRLSTLAAFLKVNMPYGATYEKPALTDEEAWDLAAFVNSMPRPHREFPADWPDLKSKPVDHPFGPYADGYSEKEHKYGPFGPIIESQKRR